MDWHLILHWFTAQWTCLGFEQDFHYARWKCGICGKEILEKVHCPY